MRILVNSVVTSINYWKSCKIKRQNLRPFSIKDTELMAQSKSNAKDPASGDVFLGNVDRFSGVIIESQWERCDISVFPQKLLNSITQWKKDARRGVWFKVHLEDSDWVPVLAKNGFRFHHAKDDFVMMYLWLPATEICSIPHFAHTMIGVGGVVVNDKDQVLVVSEKYYQVPHWKLPGGYVEPGENLVDAAIREVLEETGVQTEFQSVLTIRQGHHGMFDCSDIYTVISLKPLTTDIEKCEREITRCQWMDIEEYLHHPHVHELNRFFVQKFLEYRRNNIKFDWHHGIHQVLKKPYTVYYISNNS